MSKLLSRSLETALKKAASEFPSVIMTGPRQSGKTTLLKMSFGKTHDYVSLDPLDTRQQARADPRLFLEHHKPPVIIDEIQYAPELLSYIKADIDKRRQLRGQFLLTGSQQFSLMQGVTESLAGRSAILTLLPLSWTERHGQPKHHNPLFHDGAQSPPATPPAAALAEDWIRGGFPELAVDKKRDAVLWYSSYLQTYVERDVRSLRQIGDLASFGNFLQLLASRNAQILNLSSLANDLGVAVNTAKAWLSVLEAGGLIYLVRPYYKNKGKRLVKAPKIYFTDTGLVCHLIGLKDKDHALRGPASGALMESAVLGELIRYHTNNGLKPSVYFWRTHTGEEVDFLIESGDSLIPIEVKLAATANTAWARPLERLRELFPNAVKKGFVVSLCRQKIALTELVSCVPFCWCSGV